MASSLVIPQDIIDSVIKVVDDDTRLLRRCALVSSSFLLPSRKRLFSRISIYLASENAACHRLHEVLVKNPTIQSFVRSIDIYCYARKRFEHNSQLSAILRLPFCRLEDFSINHLKCNPSNDTNESMNALSTIIRSSTLKTLSLYDVDLPITFFQGICLAELKLCSISPKNFDRKQSKTLATSEGMATSQTMIDQCVWNFYEAEHGLSEPMFLPFLRHLRVFEIRVNPNSARMENFEILSFLIRSLRISLTTPTTLEHLKLRITFDEGDNYCDHVSLIAQIGRADIWEDLDSIITHPSGSQLKRVDLDIKYGFYSGLLVEPDEDEVMEPILDALPLLREKGILFVKANLNGCG